MPNVTTKRISPPDGEGGRIESGPFITDDLNRTAAARRGRAPLKQTDADRAVADRATDSAAQELRQFVERSERLAAEKQDIADQMKEVMAEAKGRGYDTRALRRIIALRKRDPDDVAEEEAILDIYKASLGM
ncbi:DUF2312 domain-containing protein [Pseudoroseicyclus aestuarii]|uniref:Uncharacterized protein (UPF0335 family) n=1 Tax=Pseudoroseicyclus aestuarii TaxID=1795041 RepID=A0A318SMA5_9RHOB|nr:DUF2312 domain-containing protein [Pseudoroseicyclus aestuarii]PYE80836.1 uncharacterized protein (UPF0335 family) [Pseudoroseicyclus aestuarii]